MSLFLSLHKCLTSFTHSPHPLTACDLSCWFDSPCERSCFVLLPASYRTWMTKEFLTHWPFSFYCSPCGCFAPSFILCFLQKYFYFSSWFYKYYKLQTACACVSHFYRISPVCYCCTKWSWYQCPLLNLFLCLCVVQKRVQTYYHSISFLYFTSACYYFLEKTQHSLSSEVNCRSVWFNGFSLLLLWRLL